MGAEPLHEIQLVAREEHGDATCDAFGQDGGERVDAERVEARERLGGSEASARAERELLDEVVPAIAEAELLEQRGGAGLRSVSGTPFNRAK